MKETYHFSTAYELRKWLNQFKDTDLSRVTLSNGYCDYIGLKYEDSKTTDGYIVANIEVV